MNEPPGYRPGQSLLDHNAYDVLCFEQEDEYYCHDCGEVFNEIKRLEDNDDLA